MGHFQNLRWRVQHGGSKFEKYSSPIKICILVFLMSWNPNVIKFSKSEMADLIRRYKIWKKYWDYNKNRSSSVFEDAEPESEVKF